MKSESCGIRHVLVYTHLSPNRGNAREIMHKITSATAVLLSLLCLAGCNEEPRVSASSSAAQALFGRRDSSEHTSDGDSFTILLTVFTDADHVNRAIASKQATGSSTGWKNLFVVHDAHSSALYMGTYSNAESATKDLNRVRSFVSTLPTGMKVKPFESANLTRMPGENPGKPEHDLNNGNGYYTVVVAHFYNSPEDGVANRRELAVKCVEQMRREGYEAYYLHGPSVSYVTVGSFDQSAYKSVVNDQGIVEARPNDETMRQVFLDFPELVINGATEIVTTVTPTGQTTRGATSTYVMLIPQRRSSRTR